MINGVETLEYIKSNVEKWIKEQTIKSKTRLSTKKNSYYITTKDTRFPSLTFVRSSNHNPNFHNVVKNLKRPHLFSLIGLIFTEPYIDTRTGKHKRAPEADTEVEQKPNLRLKPFHMKMYRYTASPLNDGKDEERPEPLDPEDIPLIYEAIIEFIKTGIYKDPFNDTPKAAKPYVLKAEILDNREIVYYDTETKEEIIRISFKDNNFSSTLFSYLYDDVDIVIESIGSNRKYQKEAYKRQLKQMLESLK